MISRHEIVGVFVFVCTIGLLNYFTTSSTIIVVVANIISRRNEYFMIQKCSSQSRCLNLNQITTCIPSLNETIQSETWITLMKNVPILQFTFDQQAEMADKIMKKYVHQQIGNCFPRRDTELILLKYLSLVRYSCSFISNIAYLTKHSDDSLHWFSIYQRLRDQCILSNQWIL